MNTINTNHAAERVSEDVRRAHSAAIRRRAQWRERYAVLSMSIRKHKQHLQKVNRANSNDRAAEIELHALRHYADLMMLDREWIKCELRETAYEYVDIAEDIAA